MDSCLEYPESSQLNLVARVVLRSAILVVDPGGLDESEYKRVWHHIFAFQSSTNGAS